MKWTILDGKKEPDFKTDVLVLDELGEWFKGYLYEKKENGTGKTYSFHRYDKSEIITNATHYMEVEPPKNKE